MRYRDSHIFLPGKMMPFLLCFALLTFAVIDLHANDNETVKWPPRLTGHGGPIKAISLSGDGRRALTASFDYSIILWDISGAQAIILRRLIGHEGAVNDAMFFAKDTRAISVSDDGGTAIWDLETGTQIKMFTGLPNKVLDVAVSPNEKYAAIARWDKSAHLIDLNKLQQKAVLKMHRGHVNAVAFSDDSAFLYTASQDGYLRQFRVATGAFMRPLYAHGWSINVLANSSDGHGLYFGTGDGRVGKFDLKSDKDLLFTNKFDRPVLSISLSTDGTLLAAGGGDGVIHVYDSQSGHLLEKIPAAYGPVWDIAFTPLGHHLYHVGLDDFALLWQLSPPEFKPIQSNNPRRFKLANSDDVGENEFQRKCSICHTLEKDGLNRAGPTLFGLFGREAGTLPGYPYSKALKESKIIWNEKTIGQLFDEGPDIITPGSKMPVQRLKSVERRDDLIRFLKNATKANQ